jgi:hypothetical protein
MRTAPGADRSFDPGRDMDAGRLTARRRASHFETGAPPAWARRSSGEAEDAHGLGTLYLQKWALKRLGDPETVTVTIAPK